MSVINCFEKSSKTEIVLDGLIQRIQSQSEEIKRLKQKNIGLEFKLATIIPKTSLINFKDKLIETNIQLIDMLVNMSIEFQILSEQICNQLTDLKVELTTSKPNSSLNVIDVASKISNAKDFVTKLCMIQSTNIQIEADEYRQLYNEIEKLVEDVIF